jgi:hypothetical protein
MKMTLVATQTRQDPKPYLEHVAVRIAEVLPAVLTYDAEDLTARMALEGRLGELEHACKLAREAL